jgi:hypothetical protein
MINKKHHAQTRLILFTSLFVVNIGYAQEPQGSEEVLSHKPITGHDLYTGMSFRVYESVRNQTFEAQKSFSKMTFYIAPLYRLIPDPTTQQPYRRQVLEEEGIAYYTFWVECFHPRIYHQALQRIQSHYKQSQFQFQPNKIHPMTHSMVVIKASLPGQKLSKAVKPVRIRNNQDASSNTSSALNRLETFSLEVPLEVDDSFQQVLGEDGTGMTFDFITYFNVMNLRIKQIVWHADQIRKSQAYQELMGQGAKYYEANQIRDLLDQVAREIGVFDYQDPGIEDQLDNQVREAFEKLAQDTQEIALNSYTEAADFEAKLLEGTGLSLNEFKPITLMWEVTQEIEGITDYKEANKAINKVYQNQKVTLQNKLKDYERRQKELKTGLEIKGGLNSSPGKKNTEKKLSLASFLGFSIDGKFDINYKNSSDIVNELKQAIDRLDELTLNDTFEDEESFKNYQKRVNKRQGQEIEIVGRGLNLIEKNHLDRNLSALGGYLAVRPFHQARAFNASSRLKPKQAVQTITLDNFQFPLSLAKNSPFVEFDTTLNEETHDSRQGLTQRIPLENGRYLLRFHYIPPKASFYHFLVLKNNSTQTEIVDNSGQIALMFALEPKDRVQVQIDCNRSYCQQGVVTLTDIVVTKKPGQNW